MSKPYWELCPQGSTPAERAKYNVGPIFRNEARCLTCQEVIRSHHRHDFRSCSCGNLAVDGGSEYLKRCYTGPFEELSETYTDVEVHKTIHYGELHK
jgi:hypothetical protein